MMRIFGLLLMLALFFSCASQKEVAQNKKGRCAIKDSAQYELIVFDSGFDFWLTSHQSMASQHSRGYVFQVLRRHEQDKTNPRKQKPLIILDLMILDFKFQPHKLSLLLISQSKIINH